MKSNHGPNSMRSCRGNMPFALVAVTILLIASGYCVVSASIRETESESENISEDISALSGTIEDTTTFIDSGLGKIVYDLCTTPSLGNLSQREKYFYESADQWLKFQFPLESSGVKVRYIDHSLVMKSQNLQIDAESLDGYTPSYLKVTGTVTVEFESEYGKTTKNLEISTDGSCALPLTLEQGSLFENSVTGIDSLLSQMVSYQLTSLAQYRVINGYGAFSQYGSKGTASILTQSDVEDAYNNALSALECIYFRDSSGKTYFGDTDLAKDLISENGCISIDLNSVYAQALYAQVDNIVAKWFDYFLGNEIISKLDGISDDLKNAWDSLVSFFTGTNQFSAEPYIRNVIGDTDVNVCNGESFQITISDAEGNTRTFCANYPHVDLYGSDAIRNFKSEYRQENNAIRSWITSVVNSAILEISNGKGLGTISVYTSDSKTFSETLANAIDKALAGSMESFAEVAKSMLGSESVPDEFYCAIYDKILDKKDSIFHYSRSAFLSSISPDLVPQIISEFSTDEHQVTEEEAYAMLDASFNIDGNRMYMNHFRDSVDALLTKLEKIKEVEGKDSSIIKEVCIGILSDKLSCIDVHSDIEAVARSMCQEFRTYIEINPYNGYSDLPEDDEFVLVGDSTYSEKMTVATHSDPDIHIGRASDSMSVHETGFEDHSNASFCTVFPVTLKDTLTFEVSSSGTLFQALGITDSAYCNTVTIDLEMNISVASGWGLCGVDYTPSTNIINDLERLLMAVVEPLIEPLMDLIRKAQDIMNTISEAIMTLTQYVSEYLEELYNEFMEPYERMLSLMQDVAVKYLCECIIEIADGAEAIVDVSAANQTVGFRYMGFTVLFTFNMVTLEKYTKNIVKAEFSGNINGADFTSFINIKTKGESVKTPYITAGFTITGSDWDISAKIDPTMTTNKNLMSLSGTVKGIDIEAVFPEAVQYNEIGISLQDIPGISTILSNIPSPIAGTKVEIDAGVSLKYNVPIETGVLVNEFESNPEGTDKGKEWAEIINLSGSTVDLTNWTLTTSKNKVHVIKDVTLSPGERTVICFEGTFLVNSKEYLILKDPDGVEVDRSASMSDSYNDGKTCQRGMDGSTEWSLLSGTCGTANKGGLFGANGMVTSVVKDIVKDAASKAINEVKHVYTVEALEDLFTRMVKYAVDDGIDRLSDCMVEGSIYVSVDFTDLSSTGHSGFRIYVMVDGDIVGDILKYLLGKAEALFLNIDDPYNINIDTVLYDDVYFGVSVYGGIKAPSFLGNKTVDKQVLLGVDICCNLSAIGSLLNCETGTPKVKAQIGIRDCPYELIPKALGVKKNMNYDLWFLRVTFSPADTGTGS